MAPVRRALIAITSAHAPLYPEGKETGRPCAFSYISKGQLKVQTLMKITGLFVTEALHPFQVFRQAGFEVDLVSETGTYQPDWLSLQKDWLNDKDRAEWEDHTSEFRSKLDKLLKPSDIEPAKVTYYSADFDVPFA